MKAVAILMAAALLLNGCSNSTTVQEAPGAIWQAQLLGGKGQASGFSFVTQFSFNGNGSLTPGPFQFLTNDSGSCFPLVVVPVWRQHSYAHWAVSWSRVRDRADG